VLALSPVQRAAAVSLPAPLAQGPDVLPGVIFTKTVVYAASFDAAVSACQTSTATTVIAAPGTTVYYCYTLTNGSPAAIALQTLFDDNGAAVVNWAPGQLLAPGATLLPTAGNGLVRAVSIPGNATANTTITARAQWTVEQNEAAYLVQSQAATTVNVVVPNVTASLRVGATATAATCPTTVSAAIPIANNAYGVAYFCLFLTNTGNITLTTHTVTIPALGINGTLTANVPPTNGTLNITYTSNLNAPWLANLRQEIRHASLTVSAIRHLQRGVSSRTCSRDVGVGRHCHRAVRRHHGQSLFCE
jgi:hypothetical protein